MARMTKPQQKQNAVREEMIGLLRGFLGDLDLSSLDATNSIIRAYYSDDDGERFYMKGVSEAMLALGFSEGDRSRIQSSVVAIKGSSNVPFESIQRLWAAAERDAIESAMAPATAARKPVAL